MKNVSVLTEDGAFALFFRPHPGGFDGSRVPTPRNLPSKPKKMLMPGDQPGGVGGLGAGGIDWCIILEFRTLSVIKLVLISSQLVNKKKSLFWWKPFFAYILSDNNQPMVFLLILQISYSFFKFIRKYFEAYTSIVWSKHNLSIVCPFSDITIGGILGKCNINFVAKRVFALACCRRLDSGDGAKKSEQEKNRGVGWGSLLTPSSFLLLLPLRSPSLATLHHLNAMENICGSPFVLNDRDYFFLL